MTPSRAWKAAFAYPVCPVLLVRPVYRCLARISSESWLDTYLPGTRRYRTFPSFSSDPFRICSALRSHTRRDLHPRFACEAPMMGQLCRKSRNGNHMASSFDERPRFKMLLWAPSGLRLSNSIQPPVEIFSDTVLCLCQGIQYSKRYVGTTVSAAGTRNMVLREGHVLRW